MGFTNCPQWRFVEKPYYLLYFKTKSINIYIKFKINCKYIIILSKSPLSITTTLSLFEIFIEDGEKILFKYCNQSI